MEKLAYYWKRLRKNRLAYNLVLIGAIILAMAVAAHIVMQVGTRHGARRTVPDFSGVKLDQAQRMARKYDLKLHINDSLFVPAYEGGIVLDQLPEGGVEVKPGRTVYITINSFRQKMVPVPTWRDVRCGRPRTCWRSRGWRSTSWSTAPTWRPTTYWTNTATAAP